MFTIEELDRAGEIVHGILPVTPQIRWPLLCERVAASKAVSTPTVDTMADGLSCRVPNPEAVVIINHNVDHVVTIPDSEIMEAMRIYYSATHNVAEGAAAAPLAALLQEQQIVRNKRVALIHSGCNIDRDRFASILAG